MTQITSDKKKHPSAAMPARPMKLWQDNSHNQEVRIEIIPLIDVIFCVLTFFILAAVGLSRQQAITLDLPQANTGKPQMREMLVVSLDDFGQYYIEQQLVSRNQLEQAIADYHQVNPDGLMVLHAARNASYNEVIQVLDMLREVGGKRVALATLPGESSKKVNLTPDSGKNYLPYQQKSPESSLNPIESNDPLNSQPQSEIYRYDPYNLSLPDSQTTPSNTTGIND